MAKSNDDGLLYFIDIDLFSKEIINWDIDTRGTLRNEKLEIPGLHRIFLSKGQYNKLVTNLKKYHKKD